MTFDEYNLETRKTGLRGIDRGMMAQDQALKNLMTLSKQGNKAATAELLKTCESMFRRFLKAKARYYSSMSVSLIDDVLQEALIGVYEKRHTYEEKFPFMPWCFAIVRYKFLDLLRRERIRALEVDIKEWEIAHLPTDVGGSHDNSSCDAQMDLEKLLVSLPEKTRELLRLVKLEGMTAAEAGALMNLNESAVKVSIHRAIKSMRSLLHKKEREL